MRHLLVLLMLLPLTALCQNKDDNQIIVTPNGTTNLLGQIQEMLKTEKIKVWLKDKRHKENYIGTKPYSIQHKYNSLATYSFFVKDGKIFLLGSYAWDSNAHEINYSDSFHVGWEEMERLAKKLGSITYSRKRKAINAGHEPDSSPANSVTK